MKQIWYQVLLLFWAAQRARSNGAGIALKDTTASSPSQEVVKINLHISFRIYKSHPCFLLLQVDNYCFYSYADTITDFARVFSYLQDKFKLSIKSTRKSYGKEIIVIIPILHKRIMKLREINALSKGIQIISDKFRELKPYFYDFKATTGFLPHWSVYLNQFTCVRGRERDSDTETQGGETERERLFFRTVVIEHCCFM